MAKMMADILARERCSIHGRTSRYVTAAEEARDKEGGMLRQRCGRLAILLSYLNVYSSKIRSELMEELLSIIA